MAKKLTKAQKEYFKICFAPERCKSLNRPLLLSADPDLSDWYANIFFMQPIDQDADPDIHEVTMAISMNDYSDERLLALGKFLVALYSPEE